MNLDTGEHYATGVKSAFAWEEITVADAVIGLTAGTYAPDNEEAATLAIITVDAQPIRVRFDGGDPSTDNGHGLNADDVITIRGANNIRNFKAIREGGTSATIQVTYLR